MRDELDLGEEVTRPTAAELEATCAEIAAFRSRQKFATKIDLAIGWVRERGTASSAELHTLLEIAPEVAVSTYLAPATKDGRLVKEGKTWTLGPNAPAASQAVEWKPDALASGGELGRKDPLAIPTFAPTAAPTAAPAAAPEPAAARPTKKSSCRFAIWSNGVVEIKKPNEPSVELTLDEVDELIAFLTKMGNA